MKIKGKRNKSNMQKSRKQLRKEARKSKKINRNNYYTNRRKPGQYVLKNANNSEDEGFSAPILSKKKSGNNAKENKILVEEIRKQEKKKQVKLQKEMNKQRNKQLLEANLEEDRNIKHLEKQLKLNKRKSKSVPKSFSEDGLDYLLEVCDPENLKSSALAEQQLTEVNDEFEEDLILMTGNKDDEENIDSDDEELNLNETDSDTIDNDNENDGLDSDNSIDEDNNSVSDDEMDDSIGKRDSENETSIDNNSINEELLNSRKRPSKLSRNDCKTLKKSSDDSDGNDWDLSDNDNDSNDESDVKNIHKKNKDGTWEDIYGRLRAADGTIIDKKNDKYIPPAIRMQIENSSEDRLRTQKLERLKKQLKGLLNRLAESNMHTITTQIEDLYMNNSRNDMNNTITSLIIEALVSNILAPERLLMEHVLLVTILHANIGTEVGAHFLQTIVKKFDEALKVKNNDSKILDNLVVIMAQLYNFKLFDSKLIYEILDKLSENFEEKDVECILHILRNVGFHLRKDDPIALKNLILNLQKKASNVSDEFKNNSRLKFMLDILLAIKNNNVTKIPNYDPSYSDHLKKIMKGFIRKGNYVTQLNISLEDLLKVEEKGRWWVVGSAWTGNIENAENSNIKEKANTFSQKLLELARKQRMNTDTRRNIFCIIMSAEDYLDAFEKLLRLALKNQQEREIIHVILHCCLQEKKYNPFYSVLAQKFCEYDRKYQMTIKYSIWDKLKSLKDHSATQISNLAKLLSFLFLEKGLPISTLKVVQFSELDKLTLRFIRQILLGILLNSDLEACKSVFEKVCQSDKLKMFRESLRLFIYHFLLKNIKSQDISDDKKELLQARVKVIEKLLAGKEVKI